MRIDGDAVFLRPLALDDAEEFRDLRVRNREFFRPYEPLMADSDFTPAAIRRQLEISLDEDRSGMSYSFGIFDRAGGAMAGRIRLSNVFRGVWKNANVGYYVDQDHGGRGFATEAVRLVCRFAFSDADLHRVQAGVMPENERSIRVLEKAGMRREGLALRYLLINGAWRDHYLYAITAEEL
ncbi:MAG TPA: GNAT family protein [Actinomycetota bacterium]|nr:GNAT family protein [Actinomycetota bacterium]